MPPVSKHVILYTTLVQETAPYAGALVSGVDALILTLCLAGNSEEPPKSILSLLDGQDEVQGEITSYYLPPPPALSNTHIHISSDWPLAHGGKSHLAPSRGCFGKPGWLIYIYKKKGAPGVSPQDLSKWLSSDQNMGRTQLLTSEFSMRVNGCCCCC